MTLQFDFATSRRILFGAGMVAETGRIAQGFGQHPLLVRGSGQTDVSPVTAVLKQAGFDWAEAAVSGEPSIDSVRAAAEVARQNGCDLIVACGGGSVLDTGKAVAALLTNPGDLLDYVEVVGKNLPLQNPAAPMIAIPTTAGTGSEVTRNAVMSVPEHRVKVSLRSPSMLPQVALVDPELTYALPQDVTASTGMDALTQVLEPYVSSRANAMTDLFCREGLARAGRSLRAAYLNGSDTRAREDMAWTSLLGGLSLANAGLGAAHGFAAPIGGMFDAPHGAVCARLLPPVVRANIRAFEQRAPQHPALARYDEIGRLLTGDPAANRSDAAAWLEETTAALQIRRLRDYGITTSEFDAIIDKAMQSSSMKGNPIALDRGELALILQEAC